MKRNNIVFISMLILIATTTNAQVVWEGRKIKKSDFALNENKQIHTKRAEDYWTYTNFKVLTEEEKEAWREMTPTQRKKHHKEVIKEVKALSDKLENYIRAWYRGEAPSELPFGLLPSSIDNIKTKKWKLLHPEEVKPEEQWYFRPAMDIPEDFSKLYFLGPDNHVTYMKCIFIAPFNSQLLVEGDFPHSRFMDYQILQPFDPENPTTSGLGAPEVPIVDVDIKPDTGCINPFLPGANRNAKNRHYHIVFDLKIGNACKLNPQAMIAPMYRAPGNRRSGGPFAYSGPTGNGTIISSVVWLRYYAPDKAVGPLGGVGFPKVLLRLKTGETFWLQCDFSLAAQRQNTSVAGFRTPPIEPEKFIGSTVGWFKMFGFWLTFADGMAYTLVKPWGPFPKWLASTIIQKQDRIFYGRGPNREPPGNYECSASGMNYATYLFRVMALGNGKIYVLTGKLPKTPKTRNSELVTTTAEARYWSITHTGKGKDGKYPSLLYGSLMDDEIITDSDNRYIIVYSRKEDRPKNAKPEYGITWQDYGQESRQVFNIRWVSVMPDDYLPGYAPHQNNISWKKGEWSSFQWDPKIMSFNNQKVFMKEYQPIVYYMKKEKFEVLGTTNITAERIPKWR